MRGAQKLRGTVQTPKMPRDQGQVLSWANEVNRALRQLRDRMVPGRASGVGSRTRPSPLQIIKGTETGEYKITTGTVNSETPTLGGTALDDAAPPEFTVAATTYVWIKCVGVFATPDTYTVTIETTTTAGVPAGTAISATGFTSFFYIGEVEFTAGSPATYAITNQHSGGNLGVDSWGLYNLWWRA